jgi:hypothetical protein
MQKWTIPLTVQVSLGEHKAVVPGPRKKALGIPSQKVEESAAAESYLDKFSIPSLTRGDFDWSTALSLALAARLAYADKKEVEQVAKKWGLGRCLFVNEDDTQCFLAASSDAVVISFRGTENLGDWLANLNLIGTNQPYGRVHRGFLGAFNVVGQKLRAELQNHPGKKVLLTGHSLGGALALIAAAEWSSTVPAISWVHTCGQPAVGKKNFRVFLTSRYEGRYYRFVNDRDIVPMVPPTYRHAGELIHFSEDGDLENALATEELESLGIDLGTVNEDTPMMDEPEFDQMRAQLLFERSARGGESLSEESVERAALEATGEEGVEGFLPSISDHSMDLYVAKIARKAGV